METEAFRRLPIFRLGNLDIFDARGELPDDASGGRWVYRRRGLSIVRHISIHHWASSPWTGSESVDEELAAMRAVRALHRSDDGVHFWAGYAYHFTVFPSGRAYYTGDVATTRAVIGRENVANIAVALPGQYRQSPPSHHHLLAVARVVAEVQFSMGSLLPVFGHRHFGGTVCPGESWPLWAAQVGG